MSIASGYGPNWTTAESRGLDAQRRIAELEHQLAAAEAEARELGLTLSETIAREKELRAELARAQETISMRNRMIDGLREWMRDHCAALSPAPEPAAPAPELPRICCRACEPEQLKAAGLHPLLNRTFVVCPKCHNKRCPKAENHRNRCTGSNEPGQVAEPELPLMAEATFVRLYDQLDITDHPIVELGGQRFRVTDTDEHGLPVIPREKGTRESAAYRWRYLGDDKWNYVRELRERPKSEEWQRIEDFNEHAQGGQEGRNG